MTTSDAKMRSRGSQPNLIRSNHKIKKILATIFDKEGMMNRDVIKDAANFGYKISEAAMSRYMKHRGNLNGMLTERDVMFLCARWGVNIVISGEPEAFSNEDKAKLLIVNFPELKEHIESQFNLTFRVKK